MRTFLVSGSLAAVAIFSRKGLHIHVVKRIMSKLPHASSSLCVHAPTTEELKTARRTLSDRLIAAKGEPVEYAQPSYPLLEQQEVSESISGSFVPSKYYARLGTNKLGHILFTASALPSTQVIIQDNSHCIPDGAVCIADKQYGGKGRGGNVWESPAGCLMFSMTLKLSIPGERLPFVQYLVCLAVVQAARAAARDILKSNEDTIDLRIKWPNDIYAGPLKVGGILCHSAYRDKEFVVTMGVGLNVSNREPSTCLDALISSVGSQPTRPIERERLLADVLTRLEPMLLRLSEVGFAEFEKDYSDLWLHTNQQVLIEEGDVKIPVVICGLSRHGYLSARDAGGELYELHPDGNSFDFFSGLVRKRIKT